MNQIKQLLFICLVFILQGCGKDFGFSYKVLNGDSDISKMPFGNNQELIGPKETEIEYKVINDSIYTSIYIGAHAGCPGTEILPKITSKQGKLILSVTLDRETFAKNCLLNIIQLNFKVKNNNYKGVFYLPLESGRPQ
jgi:hypothetical protein